MALGKVDFCRFVSDIFLTALVGFGSCEETSPTPYNFHYCSINFTILKYNLHNFRCNLHYFLLTTAQNCLADKFRSKTELKVS